MKTLLPLAALIILLASCSSQNTEATKVTSSKIDTATLPKDIKHKGGIDTAIKYTDNEGEHILITSEDADIDGDRLTGVYLYAYCYKLTGDKWRPEWHMSDMVNQCQEDVAGDFLPGTFAITDLNHDGKAEVWLMYRLACRGDVSPSDMKVIMHEGSKKYAMRGGSKVKVNATDYYGGDYKFDDAFQKAPAIFRQHAQQLWEKNKNENFDTEHPTGKFN
jgi:hypothetical protein